MRKGYVGLSGLVRNEFKKDPLLGDVFIFLSRTRNKIKLLHWQEMALHILKTIRERYV
ncbi:MAG: IS66 family insertion sequence element accessory protein TnpB [Bacteroidetes bacterium]|nr:IS66 family insertion sequence element accessory protein TnpB [Bacteroidota bacterium]